MTSNILIFLYKMIILPFSFNILYIGSVLHHLLLWLRPVDLLAPAVTEPTERLGEGGTGGSEASKVLSVHDSI